MSLDLVVINTAEGEEGNLKVQLKHSTAPQHHSNSKNICRTSEQQELHITSDKLCTPIPFSILKFWFKCDSLIQNESFRTTCRLYDSMNAPETIHLAFGLLQAA